MSLAHSQSRGSLATGIDPSLLTTHFFLLSTFVLAIIGWLVAFVAQCYSEANTFIIAGGLNLNLSGSLVVPPTVIGFACLELFLIAYVLWTILSNSIAQARHTILTFNAIAIVMAVLAIDKFVYVDRPSFRALSAGYFLMVFANILWGIFFAADSSSMTWEYLDGVAGGPARNRLYNTPGGGVSPRAQAEKSYVGYGSSQSPAVGQTFNARSNSASVPPSSAAAPAISNASMAASPAVNAGSGVSPTTLSTNPAAGVTRKARALYKYDANVDDPNELSFAKGDVLEILDLTGKWWHAKREDGNTGAVPSNYLKLIEP